MTTRSVSTYRISRGIGQYHSSDYFAVLGLPVTADTRQVRQRYLTIVRRLHPDVYGLSPEDREVASEYLAKMVSPAYNTLINDRERAEYSSLIRLIAKRMIKQDQSVQPVSAIANKLLSAPKEFSYERAIEVVAAHQFASLQKIMAYTSQLSELNLVYLVASEGYTSPELEVVTPTPQPSTPVTSASAPPLTQPPANKNSNADLSVIKKAEELIIQKQWAAALNELREILKQDNTNSKVHALLGLVYLNQKLAGMAKVSFQQALKYNPEEAIALKHISKLEQTESANGKNTSSSSSNQKKSGFFGWLGGS